MTELVFATGWSVSVFLTYSGEALVHLLFFFFFLFLFLFFFFFFSFFF